MKKTLIAILALASLAAAGADSVDVSWTFTNLEKPGSTEPTSTNRFYTRAGVSFVLQADASSYKLTSTVEAATLGETITLDSITLPNLNSAVSNMWGIICDYSGSVVGLSSSKASCAANGDLTFNYSGLELNTGERYGLVFFQTTSANTPEAMMNWITTNGWNVSGSNLHSTLQFTAVTSDYTTGQVLAIQDKNNNFSPSNTDSGFLTGIEIVGHSTFTPPGPVVPEPATGSLSLLALAGLCARRRRK